MPRRPDTITARADDMETDDRPGVKRRGGRPSREEAARLGDRILDIATDLFLADGYGATSIEDIARTAQISKRTFYHRYPDKRALFAAVVQRVVERVQPANVPALFADDAPLDQVLLRLARAILRAALAPQALALHRMIVAEAGRFPDLAAVVAGQGATPAAITQIAAVLARGGSAGTLTSERTRFAATQFFHMVVAVPQRRALGLGEPMTPEEIEPWARDTVRLFLSGYRGA